MQYKQFSELKDGDKFSTELIPNNVFVKVYGENKGCSINSGIVIQFQPETKVKTGINIEISPEQESKPSPLPIKDNEYYTQCTYKEFKEKVKTKYGEVDIFIDQIVDSVTGNIRFQWYRFFVKDTNEEIGYWSKSYDSNKAGSGFIFGQFRHWDNIFKDRLIKANDII